MKKGLLGLLLLFAANCLQAQVPDAGAWIGYSARYKPAKRFELEVAPELRFNQNWSQLQRILADVSLTYNLTKQLELSGAYRFMWRNQTYSWDVRNRFFADAKYTQRLHKKVDLSYRLRYQYQFTDLALGVVDERSSDFLRHKVGLKIDLPKKLTANLGAEYWQPLAPWLVGVQNRRISTSLTWDQNKRHRWEIGIFEERALNTTRPATAYVVTFGHRQKF